MKEKVNEICERVKIPGLKKGEAVELIEAESKPGEKSLKESLLKEK